MVAPTFPEWSTFSSYQVYNRPLERPDNDDREYRLIRLANNLEALIISDPETDRASAALDVHVGNLSDPVTMTTFKFYSKRKGMLIQNDLEKDHLEGLAHFCEHLLFMGTEKYPKENDYYSYLSEHSGKVQYAYAF